MSKQEHIVRQKLAQALLSGIALLAVLTPIFLSGHWLLGIVDNAAHDWHLIRPATTKHRSDDSGTADNSSRLTTSLFIAQLRRGN